MPVSTGGSPARMYTRAQRYGGIQAGLPGGLAPDYSAYVTRNSWGTAGGGMGANYDASQYLSDHPNIDIQRLQVQWSSVHTASNTFNWTGGCDGHIQRRLDAGIQVLAQMSYGGVWVTGSTHSDQFYVPGINTDGTTTAAFDTFLAQYVKAWKAFVRRYHYGALGADGIAGSDNASFITSTKTVRFGEVWNEQNDVLFWHRVDGQNTGANHATPYAKMLAAVYDAIKDIAPNFFVGIGGMCNCTDANVAAGKGMKAPDFVAEACEYWSANYTKHDDGWNNIPADFCCFHPYFGGRRGGTLPKAVYYVDDDIKQNTFCNDMVAIHNVLDSYGWGSMLMWSTEMSVSWRTDAVDGYGLTSPSAPGIYSPGEARTYLRKCHRYWTGLDPWPSGGTYKLKWTYGKDATHPNGQPQLGPMIFFEMRDLADTLNAGTVNDNHGLHISSTGADPSARKALAGSANDPNDEVDTW